MKNRQVSRRDFLKGAAGTLGLAAIAAIPAAAETLTEGNAGAYTPGTYTASAAGIESDVTVTMTFSEDSITEVVVDASGETAQIGGAAAQELADQIMAGQAAEIDGVSGATLTSDAARKAASACIAQAKGVDVSALLEDTAPAAETEAAPANVQAFLSANLNPQEDDSNGFTSNTIEDFASSKYFEEWQLGGLTIKGRLVKSAAGSAYLPFVTKEEIVDEYSHWAKAGTGLIWIEDFANLYTNYPAHYKVYTRDDAYVKDIADAIHAEGSLCGYQLSLMGASFSGFDASTAAEYESAHADHMTIDELHMLQEDFIEAAKWLKEQGVDAVEINAAGNNIGQAFLSRNRNARDDEYGPQNFENRVRFLSEIIQGIKEVNGKDFPVQILINSLEENDANLGQNDRFTTVEENCEIAKALEAAGADSLHLRLGPYAMHVAEFATDLYFTGYGINGTTAFGTQFDFTRHFQGKLNYAHSGAGIGLEIAAQIKKAVSIPCGTVTYIDPAKAPDYFLKGLEDGKVDFYMMTRTMIADPDYIEKLREGRLDEIRPCNRCLSCHFDTDREGNFYEHCRVNACHMRAFHTEEMAEGTALPEGDGEKKVIVIGGGPAGMEAARIAAQRGYDVTLYEKNGYLGGLLPFAHTVKGPHENIDRYNAYLQRQLEINGVDVVLNQEVTADFIKEQNADAVILATGGKRVSTGLEGTAGTQIVPIQDILSAQAGDNVTIIGGGAQAVDTCMYLQAQGKNVTIVMEEDLSLLDKEQSSWVRTFVLPMIYARGTKVFSSASVKEVGDGTITIAANSGADFVIPCDTIIEALDEQADTSLIDGIDNAVAVGDCAQPWNIAEAVATANVAARHI